ncbi:MAG: Ig-like domain-containing protein [Acidobacteriaceae bacterium]
MVLNRHLRVHELTALGSLVFVALVSGCGTKGLNSVQVTPATQSVAVGQTAQFTAVGTYGNASRPSTQDITSSVTWTSSVPAVATINASGVATGVSGGTSTITASATGFNGPVSSSATLVVAGAGGSGAGQLLSVTIIPSSISVGNLQDTGQFLAIGTYSAAPTVRDITNSPTVTWISAAPSVFPVNNNTSGSLGATAGIVTAYGSGGAVITVEAMSNDGSIQTNTATFNCPLVLPNPPDTPGSCYPGSQAAALLSTLTVYNEGLNTTNWLVTAPSATGTPNVINCGAGAGSASVCEATYPVGTTVTLTAPANGAAFGGWSSNCTSVGTISATGPNSCTVTLTTNDTVGAIFN